MRRGARIRDRRARSYHGVYAHMGVTDFWRVQRRVARGPWRNSWPRSSSPGG